MGNYAEVAKVAGVSPTTVARVVNNRPGVRPEKAELVRRAMAKLGYEPPPAAVRRGPKTSAREGVHTKRIAYLLINMRDNAIRGITNPGPMSRALVQYGINLLYVPTDNNAKLPDIINPYQIDGIIYQGEEPVGEALETLRRIPTVRLMTRRSNDTLFDCIAPDNIAMGEMAAEYFQARGITQAAFLCTDYEYCAFKKRIDAFVSRCAQLNIRIAFSRSLITPATESLNDVRNFLEQALEHSDAGRIGVFITEACNVLPICRSFWKLSPARQKQIDLLLGDPLSFAQEQSLEDTLSYFDIRQDDLNSRAVEQLMWRMRNAASTAGAVDLLLRPVLCAKKE